MLSQHREVLFMILGLLFASVFLLLPGNYTSHVIVDDHDGRGGDLTENCPLPPVRFDVGGVGARNHNRVVQVDKEFFVLLVGIIIPDLNLNGLLGCARFKCDAALGMDVVTLALVRRLPPLRLRGPISGPELHRGGAREVARALDFDDFDAGVLEHGVLLGRELEDAHVLVLLRLPRPGLALLLHRQDLLARQQRPHAGRARPPLQPHALSAHDPSRGPDPVVGPAAVVGTLHGDDLLHLLVGDTPELSANLGLQLS
mmetsp:Transcript_15290/g.38831  ORF Transcript_15290/g.38831 Transcript_15290/m.38831 type:complete len:257 (+) Transcript_15290:1198-1968(+)